MGEGSVAPAGKKTRQNWKIKAPLDTKVQGIVVSGFKELPWAQAMFLHMDGREGPDGRRAAWLRALQGIEPITDASGKDRDPATIAFTWSGLKALNLPKEALETFSAPFREGMCQVDRLRRLGDRYDGKWKETVIGGGPVWSGNTPARDLDPTGPSDPEDEEQTHEEAIPPTPKTVHALLLLYDEHEAAVGERANLVRDTLKPFGVSIVRQLPLDLRITDGIAREHFGFADGVSQPVPYGEAIVLEDGSASPKDPWHGVPAGEILLGHVNAHHERAPGPLLNVDTGATKFELEPHPDEPHFLDLGLNGTYMVVRELRQDVTEFWKSLDEGAARINAHDPSKTPITAEWLAERVVGRHPDGRLLCPSKDGYHKTLNDVGFYKDDPYGHGCPMGSHVRRANPRDGLAPDAASAPSLLDSSNNHRILRRGRKFGKTIDNPRVDDREERGLLFICLNTDIVRQFEFVQQTWILNRNFADLYDETDPLIGPAGPFTIREQPLRRIVHVETFVQLAGGEYFFLPSMPALAYLRSL